MLVHILKIPGPIFYSVSDESAFFHWLYSIHSVGRVKGRGRHLYVDIFLEDQNAWTIREFQNLFRRYNIDAEEIRVFEVLLPVDYLFDDQTAITWELYQKTAEQK